VVVAERVCTELNYQQALRLIIWFRFSPLPKSVTPARIHSNAALYDFELSAEDMAALDALDIGADGAVSWNPVDAA
jgi:diketogulonate reductase-like aldo/keto reductase